MHCCPSYITQILSPVSNYLLHQWLCLSDCTDYNIPHTNIIIIIITFIYSYLGRNFRSSGGRGHSKSVRKWERLLLRFKSWQNQALSWVSNSRQLEPSSGRRACHSLSWWTARTALVSVMVTSEHSVLVTCCTGTVSQKQFVLWLIRNCSKRFWRPVILTYVLRSFQSFLIFTHAWSVWLCGLGTKTLNYSQTHLSG